MNLMEAYTMVYNDLVNFGSFFIGNYDAINGDEHFMYGIETVMDMIASCAGKQEEFEEIFSKNMLLSQEKSSII